MQNMQQTKVTDHNRQDFYLAVYPVQRNTVDQLIDISVFQEEIIAIDCCGWYYAEKFNRPLIMVETTTSVENYNLKPHHYTYLLEDSNDALRWPDMPYNQNAVLLLDRSPLLKYLSLQELGAVINTMIQKYNPSRILIRGNLQFIDDCRLVDRLTNWFDFLHRSNYITTKFIYDTDAMTYCLHLKKHQ